LKKKGSKKTVRGKKSTVKPTKRKNPWETRKANEAARKKKWQNAAHKAWETRRKNARSAAGKKAWENRQKAAKQTAKASVNKPVESSVRKRIREVRGKQELTPAQRAWITRRKNEQ